MQRGLRTPAVQISEMRGKSITAFDKQITPVGGVFQVYWPGGGFTWHRPRAVEVRQGGTTHRLPIYDATLRAIASIALVGLAAVVLISLSMRWVRSRKRRRTL
jgi:hypothetical protein